MKKIDFSEYDNFEKIGGGILGAVAIISAILEMIFNGISASSVVAAIKDVSGTLIVVMVLLVALKKLFPKKQQGFSNVFKQEMESIIEKYNPIIKEVESDKIEYHIADNLSCLYGEKEGVYHRLFAFSEGDNSITFKTSKTVFFGRTSDDHENDLKEIALDIAKSVAYTYECIEKFTGNKDSFTLVFKEPLSTDEAARALSEVIDKILLLYVARCKK